MQPKSHHTVPRLHLQHFAGEEPAGQVWTYDAETGRSWSTIPEETATQTHFYSAERADGSMDPTVEVFLSEVEGRAAPVYEGLLRGTIPGESPPRMDFAQFLALMYTRTTAMRRIAAEVRGRGAQIHQFAYASDPKAFEALTRRAEAEKGAPIDPAVKELIRREMLHPSGNYTIEVSKESTFMAMGAADRLTPLFYNMTWALADASEGYFITSDNALVRVVDPKTCHPIYGDHGFLNKTAEVSFPLSPGLLLVMCWERDVPARAALRRDYVNMANGARAAHSERFVYAHRRDEKIAQLVATHKDSRPAMTLEGFGPENFAPIQIARRSKKSERH